MRQTLPLILTMFLTGCTQWQDGTAYDFPVFSEDGGGVAAVRMEFEERDVGTTTRQRDFSTQVLVKDGTDASPPAPITGFLPGRARALYFMRSQGYVVLGRGSDQRYIDDGWEHDIWYDKVDVDGTVTALGSGTYQTGVSCDGGDSTTSVAGPLAFIPSPDGTMIARFESTSSCTGRDMTVTFLDAADLSILDGPTVVPDILPTGMGGFGGVPWSPADLAWTQDGAFMVGFWGTGGVMDSNLASVLRVGEETETDVSVAMDCFFPSTSSSSSHDGVASIDIDSETGSLSTTTAWSALAFGCP